MKLVRKFLRLLPLFLFILGFISPIMQSIILKEQASTFLYNENEQPSTNYTNFNRFLYNTSQFTFIFDYNPEIINDFNSNFVNLSDMNYNLVQSTCEIITFNGIEDYDELSPITIFIICLMYYELELSILFIFFDVFNFMISIASKWLRKGENLND